MVSVYGRNVEMRCCTCMVIMKFIMKYQWNEAGTLPMQSRNTKRPIRYLFNTLRPRQNDRHVPDDIFKWIFLHENVRISIRISVNFVSKVPIDNKPTLVQIMAWRQPGDKPLSYTSKNIALQFFQCHEACNISSTPYMVAISKMGIYKRLIQGYHCWSFEREIFPVI